MAKEKKNRKKGIVDPRKAERKAGRAAAKETKAASDADTATKVYKANKIAKAVESAKPEVETTTAAVTPPTTLPQLDDDVKLGYADRPIPRGDRPVAKLDAADVADDAAQAAIIREDDARKALQESGENLQPRTALDVVRGIQERRAAAEQERVAGMARVDLPSAVGEGFDEVTDEEAARRAGNRTARRGTGIVDFSKIATGGRANAGLTEEQEKRAERRTSARIEKTAAKAGIDLSRRSDAEAAFGGVLAPDEALRPYTDKPEIMDLARRLKTADLMDQGKEVTPEAVEDRLQGGPHQRMARILHYRPDLSAEELRNHLGGRESIAEDKLNELHESVMNEVRSRNKNNVLPRMGLEKDENGNFTPTELAYTETWQHPTEKDANGLPKTYKVSDMHPDMIKQLNHPWGGVQSENDYEATTVVRQTTPLSREAEKNPSLRYANTLRKTAGDYAPVSIRFGHTKNAAGAWSFTPPPAGFESGTPEGFTSNVDHLVDAIKSGNSRPGSRKSHSEIANNLVAELDPARQRVVGKRQVAIPMPGFTENGGAPATTGYKPTVMDIPHAGDDEITTYDDLPHVKDQHGNLVPLAPRSGRAGTGRSVHVVQGTMGLGQQFKSPAEQSAEVLGGAFGGADQATPVLQEENRADAAAAFGGSVETDATAAIDKGPRSSQSRRLIRGNKAVGKQFMGVQGLEPQYRGKQGIIPGFENYGNTEIQRGIPDVFDTRTFEGPIPSGVDTRAAAGLTERMTPENTPDKIIGQQVNFREVETSPGVKETVRVPGPGLPVTVRQTYLKGSPSEIINTGRPDSRTLRLRAEAGGDTSEPTTTGIEDLRRATGSSPKASDMQQAELDFSPRSSGVVRTREFMLGTVRPLTEAERSVENVGANTIRGINPPRAKFDVGATVVNEDGATVPSPTAAPATTAPAISSGEVEISKRGGGRRKLVKGESVQGTDVVTKSTKGPKKRALKRPPNSAALAE